MDNVSCPSFLLASAAGWLSGKYRKYKLPFLSSILFGLLAYLFAFTNKLLNHDETHSLFMKGATVDSGRWGLGLLDSIFPNYSMPWIYGIVTIVLMAVSVCIIIKIFSVQSKLLQVLLAGTILVFPSLIGLFGYMFASCSYALSFLLAVLAVYFLTRKHWFCRLTALVCMILSLSIYQSYVAVSASLLVLCLIQQLLHLENPLTVLRKGICYVLFLICALALYFIATQVVLKITGTTFNSYASGSITLSISSIFQSIANAYLIFLQCLTIGTHGLVPSQLSLYLHQLCLVFSAILLILWFARNGRQAPLGTALLAVLIILLPLAINCMYLITAPESIHTLVLYSFSTLYVLFVILLEAVLPAADAGRPEKILCCLAQNGITFALAAVIMVNTYIANESYLHLHLRYENAYAFYTSLISEIKLSPEFTEDSKLAVIGVYDEPDFYETQFPFVSQLTGVKGFLPDSYSNQRFLEYYIGFPIPFASGEEISGIQNSSEFAGMPVYPYYGSMQKFGNIFVVKLS